MSQAFPYTYYSCPCTNINSSRSDPKPPLEDSEEQEEDREEQTFNPHSPRANYALYPAEYLLFCNECHEIRCPRCYYEESMYYYCPSCLFETQPTLVKTETNRCTRNCYQCPICIAPLALSGFQSSTESETDTQSTKDGPFILSCPYCSWTSLEIGITFEKSLNIGGQLAKLANGGGMLESAAESTTAEVASPEKLDPPRTPGKPIASNDQFHQLSQFYKKQNQETTPSNALGSGNNALGLDSPSYLARLLATYGAGPARKPKSKIPLMREAQNDSEGLRLHNDAEDEQIISRMRELGWSGITSVTQRAQYPNTNTNLLTDLRPIATRLRAKRAKRCRTCRNFIVKPDDKRQSTRHKIKLVALHYIPRITLKPLDAASVDCSSLPPGRTLHFLLTLKNPLFETVKVTLATPAKTPGRVKSAVTILCPQFGLGANADQWEEALETGEAAKKRPKDIVPAEGQQPEAGKLWARGRNWTTVVLEVVPGRLDAPSDTSAAKTPAAPTSEIIEESGPLVFEDEVPPNDRDWQVNEDVLEVPVFVRLEYEMDVDDGPVQTSRLVAAALEDAGAGIKKERVTREVAFWTVLGVGRIVAS